MSPTANVTAFQPSLEEAVHGTCPNSRNLPLNQTVWAKVSWPLRGPRMRHVSQLGPRFGVEKE